MIDFLQSFEEYLEISHPSICHPPGHAILEYEVYYKQILTSVRKEHDPL